MTGWTWRAGSLFYLNVKDMYKPQDARRATVHLRRFVKTHKQASAGIAQTIMVNIAASEIQEEVFDEQAQVTGSDYSRSRLTH